MLTVTLLNGEGELIEKVEVPYNGSVAPNDVLVQESDENSWCFDVIGWDKSITNVKEDVTASALTNMCRRTIFISNFPSTRIRFHTPLRA